MDSDVTVSEVHSQGTLGVSFTGVCDICLWGASVVSLLGNSEVRGVIFRVLGVPGPLERLVVGIPGGGVVGRFAFLVPHFLVLLGAFPGAFVVFSSTLEVRSAEGLVASSPGSQAS